MKTELPFIAVSDLVLYFLVAIPDKRSENDRVFEILKVRNLKREQAHRPKYGEEPPTWGDLRDKVELVNLAKMETSYYFLRLAIAIWCAINPILNNVSAE